MKQKSVNITTTQAKAASHPGTNKGNRAGFLEGDVVTEFDGVEVGKETGTGPNGIPNGIKLRRLVVIT